MLLFLSVFIGSMIFIHIIIVISDLFTPTKKIKQTGILAKNDPIRQPEGIPIDLSNEDFYELFYSSKDNLYNSKPFTNNKEFQLAIDLFINNHSFFLTGAAGTGKSSFINYIISKTDKRYILLAPTGIASLNIQGQTIHSFFKFDYKLDLIRYESNDIPKFPIKSNRRKLVENIDVVIIDEISMVRVDMMDAIDYSLRINGGNPNLPFGGKQIILVGDVFQLGPIFKPQKHIELFDYWSNIYFFNSHAFQKTSFDTIELKTNYRNINDYDFIRLLDKIKIKNITKKELFLLNQDRVFTDINQIDNKIILTTTNPNAKKFNDLCLKRLDTDSEFYQAEINGEYPRFIYPTDDELELKIGAQIIFIKNDYPDKKWVNGTMGKIVELNEDTIFIKIKDGVTVNVNRYSFENFKFTYNTISRKTEKVKIGTFFQFPIKLAWAITIHKSQGLTFDDVIIDVSSGTFCTGQFYVALSRARKLNNIYFMTPIQLHHIKVDNAIINFYDNNILS